MQFRKFGLISGGPHFNVPSLPVYSSAVRATLRNQTDTTILVVGDSTGAGFLGAGGFTNARVTSWPQVLVGLLQSKFGSNLVNGAGIIGSGNVGNVAATTAAYDPRVTQPAGWVDQNSLLFAGPAMLNQTNTNPLVIAPTRPFDILKTYTAAITANAGATTLFSIDSDPTLRTVSNSAGSGALIESVDTVALGVHTLSVIRGGVNKSYFYGAQFLNSTRKRINVLSAGCASGKIADMLTATFGASQFLPKLQPHLTIICLTINDWNAGTNTGTFSTNTQSLITQALVYGDVILMTGVPTSTAVTAQATQDTFTAVYQSLAASNGLLLIDMLSYWTSYAVANAASLYGDTKHPNVAGYGVGGSGILPISQIVKNVIAP